MTVRILQSIMLSLLSILPSKAGVPLTRDICFDLLDEEIELWPKYASYRQHKADSLTQIYLHETKLQPWWKATKELVDVYDGFQNDSALFYIEKLYNTAPWMPDSSYVNLCRIRMAELLTKCGTYHTAFNFLNAVDTTTLHSYGMADYYRAMEFVYEEMANYTYLWFKKDEYKEKEHFYRLKLFEVLVPETPECLMYESYDLLMQKRYDEAYDRAMQCLEKAQPQTRAYDYMTFYLRFICEELNRYDESNYWLAQSALSELRQGLRDQRSLWSLADRMSDDEIDRSYSYLRFTWNVMSEGGTKIFTQHLLPVMGTLTNEHDAKVEALGHKQQCLIVGLIVLSVILIAILFYLNIQRKRLFDARNKLSQANQRLFEINHLLEHANNTLRTTNEELRQTNSKLEDANRVKEHYIISFFDICAGYIDKMEENRKTDSKMLRKGQMAEVLKKMSSPNFTQKELNGLYDHFDEVFLGLYPHFVEDFNSLLHEEARIKVAHKARMNTPLRIFALLRLGIERPNDVAKFLHCSSVTVYNYRTQFKNAYIGNRDEFEDSVKCIGLTN